MSDGDPISDIQKKQANGLRKQFEKNDLEEKKWRKLWIKYHQKLRS